MHIIIGTTGKHDMANGSGLLDGGLVNGRDALVQHATIVLEVKVGPDANQSNHNHCHYKAQGSAALAPCLVSARSRIHYEHFAGPCDD